MKVLNLWNVLTVEGWSSIQPMPAVLSATKECWTHSWTDMSPGIINTYSWSPLGEIFLFSLLLDNARRFSLSFIIVMEQIKTIYPSCSSFFWHNLFFSGLVLSLLFMCMFYLLELKTKFNLIIRWVSLFCRQRVRCIDVSLQLLNMWTLSKLV